MVPPGIFRFSAGSPIPYPALEGWATVGAGRGQPSRPKCVSENSIPRAQTGCTRAKMPPHYCSTLRPSIFAEWGLKFKANYRRGVFRVENLTVDKRVRATMSHAQV